MSEPFLRRRVAVHAQLPAGTTSRLLTWCQEHRCLSKPSLGLVFRHRANRRRGKRVLCSAQLPAGTTSTIPTCVSVNHFVGPLRRTQTATAGMNAWLRRLQNKDRLPIGVHACKAAGCGFESHRLCLISWRRSSTGEQRKPLINTSSIPAIHDRLPDWSTSTLNRGDAGSTPAGPTTGISGL